VNLGYDYIMNMTCKKFTHKDAVDLQELERVEVNGSRYYISPQGTRLPSVTTVVGWEKRHFFAEWRRKNPEESRRVSTRGTRFHSLVEDYINNKDDLKERYTPNLLDLFLSLKSDIDRIDNIRAQEVPLWSETIGLAGRVDCIAEFDGKLSVIDFKTSKRRKTKDEIENYFQQATAYALMWQERTGEPIDTIVILMTCDDGTTQVFRESPMNFVGSLYTTIQNYRKEHQ